MTALTVPDSTNMIEAVARAAVAGMPSPDTRRVYQSRIEDFLAFLSVATINRAAVQSWLLSLRTSGKGAASVNQSLSAVKKLTEELAERGVIDSATADSIRRLKGQKQPGVRVGNWLTIEEAWKLMDAPTALRDRALLALLIGCGVRRAEAANLNWDRFQRRFGRWVLADIRGKGGRVRTVAVPNWAADRLNAYKGGAQTGSIFSLTAPGIWWVVRHWASKTGLQAAPHDLRRTYAALARDGGADLRVIQAEMGHASVATTERYLGAIENLKMGSAAGDFIGKIDN